MSDVFIVDLFYFLINKNINIFCCIDINILQVCQNYIKHVILNTLQVFYKYNKINLHHFSIFYNISIFSFLSFVGK